MASALDRVLSQMRSIQEEARGKGHIVRPKWPMIVLQTPKGWTGPKTVDGLPIEGSFRSHQVPISNLRERPDHLQLLEDWMRSYKPQELFDSNGALLPDLAEYERRPIDA
jgi:xylulose-5-phosphate/fructose-6-phosphate phosphoketolase